MNAMIFAAGLGTRLKPITDTMPKAMVPLGGRPLIQILLERLKAAGAKEIVVNVHHFAQQIIDFVRSNNGFGLDIRFSDETDMLLETGGGLKAAMPLFSTQEPVLVHNVDIISNADLAAFYRKAKTTTLLVSQRDTQRYLVFDDSNLLIGWVNLATRQVKSPYERLRRLAAMATDAESLRRSIEADYHLYAFSGIHVFYPSLLPYMYGWQGKFSIIDFYLSVCDKEPIRCFHMPNLKLIDVGKLDTLAQAEALLSLADKD